MRAPDANGVVPPGAAWCSGRGNEAALRRLRRRFLEYREDEHAQIYLLVAILLGGFIAGTIDIGAAALINWVSPILILHFIAGGLLGKAALGGGTPVALLGLLLQWAMSLIIAFFAQRFASDAK